MGRFASAARQAASVMKILQGKIIKSAGTVRNYEQALTRVAESAKEEKLNGLQSLTKQQAQTYLENRAMEIGQKTLDMERQAIQAMMQNVTFKLDRNEYLRVVKSEQEQCLASRAYTTDQCNFIVNAQNEKNGLATELAYAAGLRAHELFSLLPVAERVADVRPTLETKWQGRQGQLYTVQGKGGLVREVIIPNHLAERLELHRLGEPVRVTDRGIHYLSCYAIGAGQRWSNSFTAASSRVLGWAAGGHGLRHSYAQERMHELQCLGLTRNLALETVSQEMGHFRAQITETYLR